MTLLLAAVLGTLFGFVLHRTGAADPARILGMLRLTDLHLARTILLAIGISTALLAVGLAAGLVDPAHLHVKPIHAGVIAGGLVFGVGWALSGYCPGTGIAAAGAGRRDAAAFVLGGLAGAGLFMAMYGRIEGTALLASLGGKISLYPEGGARALVAGPAGTALAVAIGAALMLLARTARNPR